MNELELAIFKLAQTLHLLKSLIYIMIIYNRGLFFMYYFYIFLNLI